MSSSNFPQSTTISQQPEQPLRVKLGKFMSHEIVPGPARSTEEGKRRGCRGNLSRSGGSTSASLPLRSPLLLRATPVASTLLRLLPSPACPSTGVYTLRPLPRRPCHLPGGGRWMFLLLPVRCGPPVAQTAATQQGFGEAPARAPHEKSCRQALQTRRHRHGFPPG